MNGEGTRTRVKICGLTHPEDVAGAVRAGADAVGVITEVPVDTPREVDPELAADLLADVPPFIAATLVTMTDDPEDAIDLVERIGPDAIQIHGRPDPAACEAIRAAGADLLLSVGTDHLEGIGRYEGRVDALIVDSTDEEGAGGTGETHDWERTRAATAGLEAPVVLAGGLTPHNVTDAVRTVEPFAVDVASGVESEPGRKDPAAVEAFVERATGAEGAPGEGQR
ncbi:phosphoribosylanthranilate isomerase [Saliphagus infecundisoli]|uniref:N-(5'-phosphoribosyl)anthranilate isomerase n=1 Tax=Saliphagus infecundisoli TaxID=1849069 RepID=A0ABD5QGW8_9EURY|nr:phosphoribosylanthranilate isomerase [Saliphagus infecundisoli]